MAKWSMALFGMLTERLIIRPILGYPQFSIVMATIGLASIVHGGVEAVWGGDTYSPPTLLPRTPMKLGDVLIPGAVLGNFAVAALLIAAFLAFFRYSKTGIALRATANDPVTAATLGININYSLRLTWVLSGLVGTVAGVLIASSAGLSPLLAAAALSVFAAIILGGLDSILGAIVASLLIGWIEALGAGYLGGKSRDVVPYVVVLAILEQMGLPRNYIGFIFLIATVLLYAGIGVMSRTSAPSERFFVTASKISQNFITNSLAIWRPR